MSRASNLRIIYVFPKSFHFVQKDIEALRDHVTLHCQRFSTGPAWFLPWDYIRQFFFLLSLRAQGVRHVIAHFAGHHTVLPTALGFRTIIIIAGSDACSFPEINYGGFRKPLMRWAMCRSMHKAVRLAPVHWSLERFENRFSTFGPREQGYAHFVQDLRTPSTGIPYGFDTDSWTAPEGTRDPCSVLCVATGVEPGNAVHFRKGIDLIIQAASLLPDHRFTVIGAARPEAYQGLPSNVRIHSGCAPDELRVCFGAHTIYLQPSVMEGFPNALCEAMLMGCIPVTSDITSMPDIVGGTGVCIGKRDPSRLADAIRSISSLPAAEIQLLQQRARDRILPYTMERRIGMLLDLVADAPQGMISSERAK